MLLFISWCKGIGEWRVLGIKFQLFINPAVRADNSISPLLTKELWIKELITFRARSGFGHYWTGPPATQASQVLEAAHLKSKDSQ